MLKDRLNQLRKESKLRQEDFAKKIGVARTTYAMYEQGRRQPDYETLQKIANYYDVTIDYLLCRSDNPRLVEKEDIQKDSDVEKMLKKFESLPESERKGLENYLDFIIRQHAEKKGE